MIEPLCRDSRCQTCRFLRAVRTGQIQRRRDLVLGLLVVVAACLVLALVNGITEAIR